MIIGIGVDSVDISKMNEAIKKDSFIIHTFTENEIKNEHGIKADYYATRFAAKEAVFKAINQKIDLRKIETLNDKSGKPYVNLPDYDHKIHISITTESNIATAFCIIEE